MYDSIKSPYSKCMIALRVLITNICYKNYRNIHVVVLI